MAPYMAPWSVIASESIPSSRVYETRSGILDRPSRSENSECVWRWVNIARQPGENGLTAYVDTRTGVRIAVANRTLPPEGEGVSGRAQHELPVLAARSNPAPRAGVSRS